MIRPHMKIHLGLILKAAPGAPDQNGQHFRRTQGRASTARISREVLGAELWLQCLEILSNGAGELEQRVRSIDLLLHAHGTLPGMSGSRTTLLPLRAQALQLFAGIRGERRSTFHLRKGGMILSPPR
jgi:hypothetical protein